MFNVGFLKSMVSCNERKAMSVSILYYCTSSYLCGSHNNQYLKLGGMGEPLQKELHVQCIILYCILYTTLNSSPFIPVT